jgi:hypothetical protein
MNKSVVWCILPALLSSIIRGMSIDLYTLSGKFSRYCIPVATATPNPTRSASLDESSRKGTTNLNPPYGTNNAVAIYERENNNK